MGERLKCPVCGKPLTRAEYDRALGLWKEKQEHIKHLEAEQKKLRENQKRLEEERKRLKAQEKAYKQQVKKLTDEFQRQKTQLIKERDRLLQEQRKKFTEEMHKQRARMEKSFELRMKKEIQKGIARGIEEQKKQIKKQEEELRKAKNRMQQLERSLRISARKYEQANEEIKRLRKQLEQGITPQIEGLLEEDNLLSKLKELYPEDRFEHPGKKGDIIQIVIDQGREVGKIVYECKKVKTFNSRHIDQAREARNKRQADFAILVTNAFPSKRQFYFVEKTVFVISPISLEPITYILRASLVRIALLKMSNEAKEKAVQRVYEYLSSSEYNNKVNDIANQLFELGKELRSEISAHKRTWEKRYNIYRCLFNDIRLIDHKLKELVHDSTNNKQKLLPLRKEYIEITELGG
jgi:hypothetical protein